MSKTIGVAIMAAGNSTRMGTQKLLLPIKGKPMIEHVIRTVLQIPWSQIVVICNHETTHPVQDILCSLTTTETDEVLSLHMKTNQPLSIHTVSSHEKSTSVKIATESFDPHIDGYLFIQGDQPFIDKDILLAIQNLFDSMNDKERNTIIAPVFAGERQSPVLFGAGWRKELMDLQGDLGGRALMHMAQSFVYELPWHDHKCFVDIDTEIEYHHWK
ncbi:hypothetical protein BHU72_10855 [Desulfuribacillus stibiiarsenatis]|uniref:MobA-like NTP transferase domain-containing protein n=1 Tax=Desulfuribacillus stibiiarsenatis TaxID=1390249 RepID=A0A1E5L2E9_9FIRM|nr:nucleotidyltransferase family protein [Desulfuribacillus stibiiarsenatis]OEH84305.1 hypothetical protein BHU72_10855 [Desulfuribacillus stibiiarsenatis]